MLTNQYTSGLHLNAVEVAVLGIHQFCLWRPWRSNADELVSVFAAVFDLERDDRIRAWDNCCPHPRMHDRNAPVLDLMGLGARPSKRQTKNHSQR